MTETTAVTTPDTTPPLLKQNRLVDLTSQGPSLHQVASTLLQRALKKLQPDQPPDPNRTMIGTPVREPDDPDTATGNVHFESMTHTLVRQSFDKTTASYIEGESFLTLTPRTENPIHLAISMDEVNSLLNDHAPYLFVAFQQLQLDYWNESTKTGLRWQDLSDAFRTAVDVQSASGWDADECSLARLVAANPDKALRQPADGLSNVKACMLDIDLVDGATTTHLVAASGVVLTATCKERELILMYTIGAGYESFASMTKLGEVLPEHLALDLNGRTLKWRLIEPEGSIFDAVVWALITSQLDAIKELDPASVPVATPSSPKQRRSRLGAQERERFDQLDRAIPDWLHTGSIDDLQAYSRYIGALGALRDEAESGVFQEDNIPLIEPYAQEQMRKAITADKINEGAASLPLDTLKITVTNSFEVSGFTLPNPLDQSVETLGEFALQNTPPYQAELAFKDGRTVPAWLTVDYLTTMAQKVNIGDSYPNWLKQTLVDDPVRAAHQKTRYTCQLPLLLPLLALECKLRRKNGIDERGYTSICQLMDAIARQRPESEHAITIRPLAFIPRMRLSKAADTVANMFVIGPRAPGNGPYLLCRPLLDKPLIQFESLQNLLYALYQPGELRDSVLAWLATEALSFEYAQYVFSSGIPSLWSIPQLVFEPIIHLDLVGPVDLANTPLTGDILATLYTANTQALIELADRQSVSNNERRWTLLADSAWALFSVASNFFSGAAGTAVWVWQTIDQIQQAIDASERNDTLIEWKTTADVLLVLGIVLSHHVAARRKTSSLASFRRSRAPQVTSETTDAPVNSEPQTPVTTTPSISFDSQALTGDIPASHLSSLEPDTLVRPSMRERFLGLIDSFKIPAADLVHQPVSSTTHLCSLDAKSYAQVGENFFQVNNFDNEPVHIVDPNDPSRTGPTLKYDATSGKWTWDLKLRLRGGGPTGRIETLRRAKEQNRKKAWTALQAFLAREKPQNTAMYSALDDLLKVTDADFKEKSKAYLDQAQAVGNDYTQTLEQLQAWGKNGGDSVFYQSQIIRLTLELNRCLTSSMLAKLKIYRPLAVQLQSAADSSVPLTRSEQIDIAHQATVVSDEIIATLQTLHSSLKTLGSHHGKPAKIARDLERLLPHVTQLDLRANEIGMAYESCLRDRPETEMTVARQSIKRLTAGIADTSHELIDLNKRAISADGQAERIELLSRWSDFYTRADELILELPTAFPEQFVLARLDHLRELIGEFQTLARTRLIAELPEPEEQPLYVEREPTPSTSQTKMKTSKTRPRQTSGDKTRPTETGEPVGSIEEVSFIKLAPGSVKPQPTLNDIDTLVEALDLNLKIDDFNQKTRDDAKRPGRIPADIRDMFDHQEAKIIQSANDAEMAITRRRTAGEAPLPTATLVQDLRDGAARTRAEGIKAYATMLKQRKPRQTYLQWLVANDQVEVLKDPRGRIRTKQRKDYFQEYRILDKTNENKALWVAHFHYENLAVPDEQFTIAHLKLADAYLLTLDTKTRQSLDTFDAVDNVLRRIVNPAVRDLFLKPHLEN